MCTSHQKASEPQILGTSYRNSDSDGVGELWFADDEGLQTTPHEPRNKEFRDLLTVKCLMRFGV